MIPVAQPFRIEFGVVAAKSTRRRSERKSRATVAIWMSMIVSLSNYLNQNVVAL